LKARRRKKEVLDGSKRRSSRCNFGYVAEIDDVESTIECTVVHKIKHLKKHLKPLILVENFELKEAKTVEAKKKRTYKITDVN
jgi:hypothetical protein